MEYQEHTDYRIHPADPYGSGGSGQKTPDSMATASLVMGILAVITCCCWLGLIFGSLGILFGILSRGQEPLRGEARAGLILSGIVVGLNLLVICLVLGLGLLGSSVTMEPPVQNLPVYPDFTVPDNFLKGLWQGGTGI